MIRRVRPTSAVTAERDSSTVTVSPRSPVAEPRMTSPSGRSPIAIGSRPGMRICAYRLAPLCSARMSGLTGSPPMSRLSTMETIRSASESTLSWALPAIVRVSTMTRETPKTAMTTSTTASVELIRRRRTAASLWRC